MTNFGNFSGYALLMIVAGLGIPAMAAMNGGLGMRLQNPALATSVLFGVSWLISLLYLVLSGNAANPFRPDVPPYLYFGGIFVLFYLMSITWVAPKFGIGNAVSFVLLGQLISMTLIDHFKLFGVPQNPISLQRFIGLLLMTLGVFLVVRRA